jgi:hydrogenase maturation protein HypF
VEPATGNSLLAVGAHLKNTIALTVGDNVFISQHIGDLETAEASNAFRDIIRDFSLLFDRKPKGVVCDLHPDYLSTRYAKEAAVPVITIQHHFAHVMSCMAENELDGSLLGVSWDGTGYGPDRTIWGGEFLLTDATTYQRVACFRPFRLPGGEHAIREPRRSAIGVLYEILGEAAFDRDDLFPMREFKKPDRALFIRMLRRGVNCPQTSSVGRLFDAVSSLIGLRQYVSFEGQAAMELEFAATGHETNEAYGVRIAGEVGLCTVDWEPVVRGILNDLDRNELPGVIALKFHNSLVESIVDVAKRVQQPRVVLTGGCFQNKYLTERTVKRLRQEGFRPYWHQRVPPNDGGIALGQVFAAISSRRSVRAHDSVAARSGAAAQETIREESLK